MGGSRSRQNIGKTTHTPIPTPPTSLTPIPMHMPMHTLTKHSHTLTHLGGSDMLPGSHAVLARALSLSRTHAHTHTHTQRERPGGIEGAPTEQRSVGSRRDQSCRNSCTHSRSSLLHIIRNIYIYIYIYISIYVYICMYENVYV